jgi:chromate transporter
MTPEPHANAPTSLRDLFVTFTLIALQGFGGVLVVTQRVLCDEKRWFATAEYLELLALGQVLPGPNVCNVALMVGNRFFGWRGALAALSGLMAVPFVITLAATVLYARFGPTSATTGAMKGIGMITAGLTGGTAMRLATGLRDNALRWPACAAIAALSFVAIALLRWPLMLVLLAVGTASCALAWRRLTPDEPSRKDPTDERDVR